MIKQTYNVKTAIFPVQPVSIFTLASNALQDTRRMLRQSDHLCVWTCVAIVNISMEVNVWIVCRDAPFVIILLLALHANQATT